MARGRKTNLSIEPKVFRNQKNDQKFISERYILAVLKTMVKFIAEESEMVVLEMDLHGRLNLSKFCFQSGWALLFLKGATFGGAHPYFSK